MGKRKLCDDCRSLVKFKEEKHKPKFCRVCNLINKLEELLSDIKEPVFKNF